ncbi:MAG: hypothetical protein WC222_06205 [Parachlamydiales bacterium]
MKKSTLKKLALLGLLSGIAATATACDTADKPEKVAEQRQLTENEFVAQLSPEGRRTYQSLDADGKRLALQLANQSCKGQNSCKGLNSCKSDTNSCAGQGGCKGSSQGPFKDKNDAVKVAAMNMAKKRTNAINGR